MLSAPLCQRQRHKPACRRRAACIGGVYSVPPDPARSGEADLRVLRTHVAARPAPSVESQDVTRTPLPEWIVPMAATLTQERFTGPDWIFERKFDGIRLLAFKREADVRLFSRNRLPQQYPRVADAIASLPVEPHDVDHVIARPVGVAPRHLVWLDGRDLRTLPLEERRAILHGLPLRAPLRRVDALTGAEPWEHACREGWEGVIA